MVKGHIYSEEISDLEINELAGYIVEAIRDEYIEIDNYYHWPERRYRYLYEDFISFANPPVGLEQTLFLRNQTQKLWEALCKRGDKNPLCITKEKINNAVLEIHDTRDEIIFDRKWFVELIVKKWGGVTSYQSANKCIDFYDQYIKGNIDNELSTMDFPYLGKEVSSWSKFLTFALPSQFQIFDSRVAFRLNTIIAEKYSSTNNARTDSNYKSVEPYLKKYIFFMPSSKSGDPCSIRKLEKKLGQKLQPSASEKSKNKVNSIAKKYCDSYMKYLRVIKAIANILQRDNIGGSKELPSEIVKQKVEMTLFSHGRILSRDVLNQYKKVLSKDDKWLNKANNEFSQTLLVNYVLEQLDKDSKYRKSETVNKFV